MNARLLLVFLVVAGCADPYTPYMRMQDEQAARHAAPTRSVAPSSSHDLAEGIALYGAMQSNTAWAQQMHQAPSMSTLQSPAPVAPIVVPRGVTCSTAGAYTSCY
ncbi:MAG: hypothetical protein HRU82_02480 [Nitrospira sp.]|nr:MAG: hypothetical protein HRU82_02480 [Nitrospira sp.]